MKGIQLVQNKWVIIWWTTGAALQHSYDYLEVCKFCMQKFHLKWCHAVGLGDISEKVLKGAVSHFRSGPPFAFKERSNFPWKKKRKKEHPCQLCLFSVQVLPRLDGLCGLGSLIMVIIMWPKSSVNLQPSLEIQEWGFSKSNKQFCIMHISHYMCVEITERHDKG